MSGSSNAKPPDEQTSVSRETLALLQEFEARLVKWNSHINLVGPNELARLWDRHIHDSLHIERLIPPTGKIVDLGSGAGFPGLIIALVTARRVVLIEADQRKAAFLRDTARGLKIDVDVIAARIEKSGVIDADVVTARALAPLTRLCSLAAPMLSSEGRCLFMKGATVELELTDARRKWQMEAVRHVVSASGAGCILEVKHLRRIGSSSD